MAKTKLNVSGSVEKFEVACEVSDVKIETIQSYGEVSIAVVLYKHPSQLFTLGSMINKVSVPKEALKEELEKATEPGEPKESKKK